MQLIISLSADALRLPAAHRHMVQSMLYHLISVQPGYASQLHNRGHEYDRRHFKLFTFGDLKGRYEFCRESKTICFFDAVQLEVRSADPLFIQVLLSALPTGKNLQLGGQPLTVTNVQLRDRHIYEQRILVRTLSPVTVRVTEADGRTLWPTPEEPLFYSILAHNADRKLRSFDPEAKPGELTITPAGNSFRKQVTRYKGEPVNAWSGDFLLEGSPRMLDFLYNTGLGSRNAQGFRMFQVLSTENESE